MIKYLYKIIIAILSSIMLITLIGGCSNTTNKSPSQVVSEQIDSIKEGDRELYKNMFWHGMVNMDSDKSVKDLFKNSSLKIDNALSQIEYTINSEDISGNEAIVNVTVTGPEFEDVWSELVKTVKNDLSSGALSITNLNLEMIGGRYDKIISDLLDNYMNSSTRTMNIKLKKDNGQWKIVNTDNIIKLTINMHPDKVKHVLNHI